MIPLVMSVIAKTETFQRDMAKAGKSVKTFSTTSSRTMATVTKLGRSMMMMAGIGGGLYMLTRGIRGAISAGLEQEKVQLQLAAAIGGNISAMKKYAAEMQAQTIYGDELILSQMAYGKNLGINTEQLQAATTAAIGLAAKYRLELNSAMMLIGRAALGQTQMLTRYGIVLDETLAPQEKFDALLKIGADNFHLAQAETKSAAGAMAQFKNNVGDLGEEISMGVLPALTDMLTSVNENKDAWKEFFRVQIEGWTEVLSGFKSTRTVLKGYLAPITPSEPSPTVNRLYSLPEDQRKSAMDVYRQHLQDAAQSRMKPGYMATQNNWREDLDLLNKIIAAYERSGKVQADIRKQTAKQTTTAKPFIGPMQEIQVQQRTAEVLKAEADAVKAQITSIQAMYDKTRMEKIQMLKDYRRAHFGHTKEIEAAEQLLNDEILSIQQSRVDAMKVYNAELKEDMEYSALYAKEKFVDAAKEIEGSMSSTFQSMIQGGANFRDAMRQFFVDIGISFSKMASDMAARAAMTGIMNMLGGGFSFTPASTGSGAYGGTGGGGSTGGASKSMRMHSGWVPYGTPSFQRGRGLKSNEMAAIIEKDEMLVPNKQIAKGVSGSANFEPKFNIIIVRDEKAAYLEAMNSKEGEKSYIRHASRNRNI